MNRHELLSLVRMRGADGVLSIYVDADPAAQMGERPAWAITVRNELRALTGRVEQEGPRRRRVVLLEALEQLDDEVADLLDASAPGRGRALFAALGGDDVRRVELQVPLPSRVVLEELAYVRPLVVALEEGRRGVLVVSRSGMRVLELELGQTSELEAVEFAPSTDDWREMKGPAGANPALAQQTAPQRDRFARRLEDRYARFLASAARRIVSLAETRDWELVLASGDPRLVVPLTEDLASSGIRAVSSERSLENLPLGDVAETVTPELRDTRKRQAAALVDQARSEALARGRRLPRSRRDAVRAWRGAGRAPRPRQRARVPRLEHDGRPPRLGGSTTGGRVSARAEARAQPCRADDRARTRDGSADQLRQRTGRRSPERQRGRRRTPALVSPSQPDEMSARARRYRRPSPRTFAGKSREPDGEVRSSIARRLFGAAATLTFIVAITLAVEFLSRA